MNNTSINIQDKYVEPKATNNQKISGIDTSDWKIYRNENYRFELKYPSVYVLNNRDIVRPILKSRYVIFNKKNDNIGTSITLELVPFQELKNASFHLGATNLEYINYIKNHSDQIKSENIDLIDKGIQIFLFNRENPGEFGDFRNTVVAMLEKEGTVLVIKKTPTLELDPEFKEILTTMRFY